MARRPDGAVPPAVLVEMPREMKDALIEVARHRRTSMTALLRQAAADLIEENKAEQQDSRAA